MLLSDTQSQSLGETFLFEADGAEFLFVQGGTSGTGDDLVAQMDLAVILTESQWPLLPVS